MAEKVMNRKDVPVELTWDLSLIYKNEEEMNQDVEKLKALTKEIKDQYQGKLNLAKNINDCLDKYSEVVIIEMALGNYASLPTEADFTDTAAAQLSHRISTIITECNTDLSFIDSEIVEQDEEVIKEAIETSKNAKSYLEELLRNKPHRLSLENEKILAQLSPCLELPSEVYYSAKYADTRFDSFEVDGKEYPMSYSLYEDNYEYEENTAVRRKAAEVFYKELRKYENTNAAAYNGYCQGQKIMASLRGFDSMFDASLFSDNIDRELYDRQIDLITTKLAPHMRKYAKLLQRIHHLDKMTYADLKLTVDPQYSPEVTIQEAHKYVREGLSVLGEDVVKMVDEAFKDRWIDFAQNVGKATGGFCSFNYGKNSYILLNYHGRMSDVFTLAHELGHANHARLFGEHQAVLNAGMSMYAGEAPSTTNELIMAHYLLKTSNDKRFRRWILSNIVSNTYYHNFVTHLLEAAFQREVYRLVDNKESVTAEILNGIMDKVLKDFWSDAVEIQEGSELTWMRQPHYYMGLYSYTYSAGLTIGTQVEKRIEALGQQAVNDWLGVMSAGGTLTAVEFAKNAGVDITTSEPLLDTIETIGQYIDEIIRLTDELENENA